MRFFAAMLIGGGIVGTTVVLIMGIRLIPQNLLSILPMAALAALFAWSALTGVRLWQGTPYGRKWAPILYASQIPILSVPGLRYQWFTGAKFGPLLRFSDGATDASITANIGANGQFYFGSAAPEIVLGINLFALVALVLLVRANRQVSSSVSN
jgi:hypothetical protein